MPAKSLKSIIAHEAYHLVFLQLIGIVLFTFFAGLFFGIKNGYSVLAGGLAYGLPNLLFVWRVFRYAGVQQMTRFVVAFFFGEMIKLILSGILFLLIVKYWPVSLSSVLIGYVAAIVSFWIACMTYFSKKKGVAR